MYRDSSAPDPLPHLDYEAFAAALDALRRELVRSLGPEDFAHLRRIARVGRASSALGYATAWIAPNPLSALLLAFGSSTRWAIVMHHVSHRGLDRVAAAPPEWKKASFAQGARRFVDWLDWISPEAWDFEHNRLHHYHTGEVLDPDLVEHNVQRLRDAEIPTALKHAAIAFYALTWKLSYYAPSTFQTLKRAERLKAARRPIDAETMDNSEVSYHVIFDPRTEEGREFWKTCVLPYGLARFVIAPGLFLPLGPIAAANVAINSVLAELLTNLHTFAIIVPNHVGDDVHRFAGPTSDRPEFYVRQILGSVNFPTGGVVNDVLHGFLNYQIEHHLWPDLPPAAYVRAAPRVKALCEEHGVPYVQQSVWRRLKQTVDVMVGKRSMRRSRPRPRGEREAARAMSDAAE
ncbi:MAG: fatty acid desaturase [Myxococcales bacterium]|nr:fatty acid desaturase [Myxococcales bacterium]